MTAPIVAKMDKFARPVSKREMTEREYKLFKDQWERYKRATKITGEILLDELWCTMEPELYQLAFGQ